MASEARAASDPSVAQWLRSENICVTGAAGALGSRLVGQLAQAGVRRIVAFDQQPIALPNDSRLGQARVEVVTGDIFDQEVLRRATDDCSALFHLAALTQAGPSRAAPSRYFEVNTMGTVRALEAAHRAGIPKVVFTSTCHVYGEPKELPVPESHAVAPQSVYAASKLAAEAAVKGFAVGYDLSCVIARLANVYSAASGGDVVVGRAVRLALAGEPIHLRNLSPIRDFIHADDVVESLIRLAAAPDDATSCRVVNVSTGRGASVGEMAETLAKVVAGEGLVVPDIKGESQSEVEAVQHLVLDNARLRDLTGWTPRISLETGLRRVVRELLGQGDR